MRNCKNRRVTLDTRDPFPKPGITPDLKEMVGPLLARDRLQNLKLNEVEGKVRYKRFVKVFNNGTLNGRVDTVWRDKLRLKEEMKPVCRVLYKPPLTKRSGEYYMGLWLLTHLLQSLIQTTMINVCSVDPEKLFFIASWRV